MTKTVYTGCAWCGKEVIGKTRRIKFCSAACRASHWRVQQQMKVKETPTEEIEEHKEIILKNMDEVGSLALRGREEALEALGLIEKRLDSWERVIKRDGRNKSSS